MACCSGPHAYSLYGVDPRPGRYNHSALELVAQSEQHTRLLVTAANAGTTHGDGHTRQQFADAGRALIANLPTGGSSPRFNAT